MTKLRVSPQLSLPLDWMTLATVVYGARGSGKTTFGSVVAEEVTKARQRFCAIDLKGDWHGLKSTADGKGEGIPVVVFGGDHQDVPLEEGAGAFMGETVASLKQSCILDFEYFSKGKQLRFLADFLESLYHHNREPLLLLADEAQRYATQKPMSPDDARCLGAMQDCVKLGRKHGLGLVIFTQRGAGLSKEVSELCDMLVAFRTPGPLDQERIKDWLDANTTRAQRDEVMGQLAGLATGSAVFASGHPDLKIFGVHAVRRRETFDSSATPRVGQRKQVAKKFAKPDLDELKTKMSAAIERAKADDPKALRARIAELEREVKAKPAPAPVVKAPKVVKLEVPVLSAADRKLLDRVASKSADNAAAATTHASAASAQTKAIVELIAKVAKATAVVPPLPVDPAFVRAFNGPTPAQLAVGAGQPKPGRVTMHAAPGFPKTMPKATTPDGKSLGKCERGILTALVQHGALSLVQAAIIAVYAPDSGGVRNAAGALRAAGFVTGGNDRLEATDAGRTWLGPVDPLPTGRDLAAFWHRKLGKCEREILRVVVDAYPKAVSLSEAAQATNPPYAADSGGVRNAAGKLRTLCLVHGGNAAMTADERLI